MSSFSSTINVLKVETTESKTLDAKTGLPFVRTAARAVLLDDAGEVVTVGRLRVPKGLVEMVKPGKFRATFALQVPDYGDSKGDIVAVLTGLTPAIERIAPAPVKP